MVNRRGGVNREGSLERGEGSIERGGGSIEKGEGSIERGGGLIEKGRVNREKGEGSFNIIMYMSYSICRCIPPY